MKVARVLIFQIGQSLFVTGKPMSCCHAMRMLVCGFLLSAAPLAARQVRGGSPQTAKASNVSASEKAKIDVCTLLTSAEIEGVQGEPVMETKASTQASGGMLMSQCVFHTTTLAKSVHVALATPERAGNLGLAPREFWQRQFHSTDVKEEESRVAGKEAPAGREEEESKARAIGGIGEEAYWVGNPVAGALYVLHGNVFLRISVGGVREESARIEKTKILARAIVKRL
jgi:hypothetical protein